MRPLSIRAKLLLIVGAPVLGALLLALIIVRGATAQARKAEALGSVERVAAVSSSISSVVQELQTERALLALYLGRRAGLKGAHAAVAAAAVPEQLARQVETRLAAQQELDAVLGARDLERLPPRLAAGLLEARVQIERLDGTRLLRDPKPDLVAALAAYDGAITPLVRATAALNDLSDDGDLLRVITCLVAALELKERVSQEHAILAFAFGAADFAPGTYRTFVNLLTEQEAFDRSYRTYATPELLRVYEAHADRAEARATDAMRKAALGAAEEALEGDADDWFRLERANVESLRDLERDLNERVRMVAFAKIAASRREIALSTALTAAVALALVVAWAVSRGVSGRVAQLRDASERVGGGDLEARVTPGPADELGQLASAFNAMTAELARSRAVLREQARMARELEIAATIQRHLLPPAPVHADFEFAGRMVPADEVGGDFYDVLTHLGDSALWITIGDVSSHGLGAGLVMLMTQAAFASQFHAAPAASPDMVLRAVNSALCANIGERLRDDKYVTAQLFAYRGDGRFTCAGAHQWPIIVRSAHGRAEMVEVEGPWLGIMSMLPSVPLLELTLEPGDILCLYSDGLTEAVGAGDELFEVPRLLAVLERTAREEAGLEQMADAILREVSAFSSDHDDDRTLLLVRRKGAAPNASPPPSAPG